MSEDRRLTKNEKRRQKKKHVDLKQAAGNHVNGKLKDVAINGKDNLQNGSSLGTHKEEVDVQIEYVSADMEREFAFGDQILDEFKSIFEKFAKPEDLTSLALVSSGGDADASSATGEVEEDKNTEEESKLSRKKKKLMSRLSVAELKQLVQRPDVVEAHDVTSSDPRLLVFLKAYRNTVPVPRHWCHKRKYLQGKRGIEKPAFQLPEFIADTGIAKIRASVIEQESMKKSKQKAKDKVQPRMGKIDIDYQVLHDAFFKYQKKPKLIGHGDLYYEGREFEVRLQKQEFVSIRFI
jgi:splicing factor 3B subunit 2